MLSKTAEHLKKQPDDSVALFQQGLAHSSLNQWSQARSIFQRLAEKHGDWPEPKNNLAVALLKQGQLEQAQKAIDAAISSQPSFKVAQSNRNKIYEYLAVQAYDKALGNHKKKVNLPEMDLLTELSLNRPEPEPRVIIKQVPAAKPVAEPVAVVQQNVSAEDVKQVKQRLLTWAKAWSESDEKNYFSSYSTAFKPTQLGNDYTQWRTIRRLRLQKHKGIQVVLDDIRIYFDADKQRALTEFVQNYRSKSYQDRIVKQLELVQHKGDWQIVSEREIQKLN